MARRTFDVVDIIEILVHWHAGRNNSEIAQSLGVDRKTAGKYIAAAVAAGMSPGGPPVTEERWAELAREWFPELADTRLRQVTWPAIEAHHDYIREQLKAGVTVRRSISGCAMSAGWRSAWRACGGMWRRTCRRRRAGRRSRCCGRGRPSRARRRRSITGGWAAGWTRRPGSR